jgi:TPR repeat protein
VKKQIKTFLAGGLLALTLFGAAAAGPVEDALAAYERGDYATALHICRALADQGNADAQNNLGRMYANGQGVPRDYVRAHMWLNLAVSR